VSDGLLVLLIILCVSTALTYAGWRSGSNSVCGHVCAPAIGEFSGETCRCAGPEGWQAPACGVWEMPRE
jgi:hypothetical protein